MIDKELWDKIEEIRKSGAESQKLHFANYQKPIPNREDMEEKDFVKKIEEIGKVFSEYQNSYSDEYNKLLAKCECQEYSKGGQAFHRGYYCPTVVMDIVIQNASRGKKVKNIPKQKPYYRYGFDSEHKLLIVDKYGDLDRHEFLVYEDNREYGITFDENIGIINISECIYDGQNRLTDYFVYSLVGSDVSGCTAEIYTYDDNGLILDLYDYSDLNQTKKLLNNLSRHERFTFPVIDGKLSEYIYEDCLPRPDYEEVCRVLDEMDKSLFENLS